MNTTAHDPAEQASGPFGRATAFVFWHLVVGVLLCVTSLPSVVLLLLLDRRAGNAFLVPFLLVPYGPVLSAALYALRARTRGDEQRPARAFVRGLRLNAVDVLRVWVPAMLVLAVVVGAVTAALASGMPVGYVAMLLVLAVLVVVWAFDALLIASFYSFRARDVARLAAFFLVRPVRTFAGTLSLVVVATALVWATTEAVLWLTAVVFAAFGLDNARALLDRVTASFTVAD